MAYIDYGSIAFKNGKCIQNSFFMDMKESVGRSIDGIDGNYFSYVGDSDLVIAFYKCQMVIFTDTLVDKVYFNCSKYTGWKSYEDYVIIKDDFVSYKVKNLGDNNYEFTMNYKNDSYRVVFGYGIDYGYYKKTGRYNYYKSFGYFVSQIPWRIKNFIYDIKYK